MRKNLTVSGGKKQQVTEHWNVLTLARCSEFLLGIKKADKISVLLKKKKKVILRTLGEHV